MKLKHLFGAFSLALCCVVSPAVAQSHPGVFISRAEGAAIRASLGKYPVLDRVVNEAKATMDTAFAHPMDVPQPGEAGGYAHERHKQNYREMQTAGVLYVITGDVRYARFVRDMLDKYSILYPTLGAHPLAGNQAPGKLFHQSLNEANWLLATAIAYDCVYDWLPAAERQKFEKNVFRPMADWLSVTQAKEFDRIHNHGTWATASVGTIGYVMGDTSYVNRALYGTRRDKTGGFLSQLDLLFSPDGYYMEGPYYIRYALMPFYQFAEAIERRQPSLRIYDYRGQILRKALYSAVETSFPNGVFPAINDASRTMAIDAPEVVLAVDLAYRRYGADARLLGAAAIQNDVVLDGAGLEVARDLAKSATPPKMTLNSIEFTNGPAGDEGGLGILRTGKGADATMVLMKYGVHGGGHGHFDQLHFVLYDGGREVVPDYGFARWINIEPKSGGRYLPENDTYAMQTIAHNTVVVDETTQNGGKDAAAEKAPAKRNFFSSSNPFVQAMSARANDQYKGVSMQRTMLLVRDARLSHPVVVDLYRVVGDVSHIYDYPIHFRGQLIATNARYTAHVSSQSPIGKGNGYQHIWNTASGPAPDPLKVTWLDGNRFYSLTSAAGNGDQVVFGRTGASDSSFNLMSEPLVILRAQAKSRLFASVIEPHGYFSEPEERSLAATPSIQAVRVIADTDDGSVVEVTGANGLKWTVMVSNGSPDASARHHIVAGGRAYDWTGGFAVEGVEAPR